MLFLKAVTPIQVIIVSNVIALDDQVKSNDLIMQRLLTCISCCRKEYLLLYQLLLFYKQDK